MTGRQGDILLAWDHAEAGDVGFVEGCSHHVAMALACYAVEYDPGDGDGWVEVLEALDEGGYGLPDAGAVDDENDRPAGEARNVRCCAASDVARVGSAVEQAHDALSDGDVGFG